MLLCAALLNAASYLLLLPSSKAIRILLHYIACILSLLLTFAATGKISLSSASGVLVFVVIFSLLYALYWGVLLLIRFLFYPERRRARSKKEQKAESEYVNRF